MLEKAPDYIFDKDSFRYREMLRLSGALKLYQNEYLYWDKIKYKKVAGLSVEKVWAGLKLERSKSQKTVRFGSYGFTYMLTDATQAALHRFDLHFGGILGSNIGIAETDKTKFVISSIMEEAIASSQMEGANTTRKKAKEMIRKELKPSTKSERMIMNNWLTMQHIVQHKADELSPERLLQIHRLIAAGTLSRHEEEGLFRQSNDIHVVNEISGEIAHDPPPYPEVEGLIADLCAFFNNEDEEDFTHPIIKGTIIHFMIGWIHPFTDGNGRTARALFYWYLLRQGYWLTEYLAISTIIKDTKVQYEKAYLYTETDENDLTYFITYHMRTMEKSYVALKDYIKRKQQEVMQAARFVRIPGVNERMAQLLKIVHDDGDRVLNSKEVEARFGVSSFTARADLKGLVDLGFLQTVQVNKVKQHFVKSAGFDTALEKYKV